MVVEFNEENHVYSINGDIAKLSVTELLAKHKLAPCYPKTQYVKDSAEYGKNVHKDLENCIFFMYEPQTWEGKQFKEWLKQNAFDNLIAEKSLGIDYEGLLVGGTADLICWKGDELWVIDHKTTTTIHKKAVTWQVNLLDYMAQFNFDTYRRATGFKCLHYDRTTQQMNVVELEKIADEEIEKLLECELNDEIYTQLGVENIDKDLQMQVEQAEKLFAIKEMEYKQAKAEVEQFRQKLCEVFEQNNIEHWESPNKIVSVTYVKPTTQKSVDTDKLKTSYPDIYNECLKTTTKKGYIKITTKK